MRLVIDLQTCQGGDAAAARHHLAEAQALVRGAGAHEVWVLLNGRMTESVETLRAALDGLLPQERVVLVETPAQDGDGWQERAAEQLREAAIAALQPDLVYVPNAFDPAAPAALWSIGRLSAASATVLGLADAAALAAPAAGASAAVLRRDATLRNATLAVCASAADGAPALATPVAPCAWLDLAVPAPVPAPKFVAASASESTSVPALAPAGEAAGGGHAKLVVMAASASHPQHTVSAIAAFALLEDALRDTWQLVIVGSFDEREHKRLQATASGFGLAPGRLRCVADGGAEAQRALYADAAVMLCTSADQRCAALEALAAGVALIVHQHDPLAPLAGAEQALYDTVDVGALALALGTVLGDPALRAAMVAHGARYALRATMAAHARRLWALFAAHAPQRAVGAAPAARRPRLAYVSPLPPERSGIADYSAELLPELARYYEIDLVLDQERVDDAWVNANLPLRTTAWFDQHAALFDRVVYHFGNSPMHQHMFKLLERHPGVVVLHDFYLGNILHHLDYNQYLPGVFQQALYHSHGFAAFAAQRRIGVNASVWKYPSNKIVLDQASGVIVHSHYPVALAERFYGPDSVGKWRTLPLLRGERSGPGRAAARAALGIADDEFVVCSFGLLGPIKCNDVLLAAWLASPLAQDPACRLVFVGANDGAEYGRAFTRALERADGARPVQLTGFVTHAEYSLWLAACDAAVQLRVDSRGETSAAVLDCLLVGVPTIANGHGASAELPETVLYKLADAFTEAELAAALAALRADPGLRAALGERARAFIAAEHAPAKVGRLYAEAIEGFAAAGSVTVADAIARLAPAGADLRELALALGANARRAGPRQLLVDISALVQTDLKTGIQRVVRSVLQALLDDTPPGYRVEPIYSEGAGLPYRYARAFMARTLGIDGWQLDDAPIDALPGDLFLGLDLATHVARLNEARLQQFRRRGVQIVFVVYDILPILRPDVFPPSAEHDFLAWLPMIARVADGLVCISRAVADEVATYLGSLEAAPRRPLQLGYFHLGADIDASAPSSGMPETAADVLAQLATRPTFLMVGTIEPRKGHAQSLAAFELLWEQGVDVNLVIVGKQGWMMEATAARLRAHPRAGSTLFWFDGASDEWLLALYGAARALLAASEGEGFGLPLIEAAQHGVAILARDLPVFREVAGAHAHYFSGLDPADLAAAVQDWLRLDAAGAAPGVAGMAWLDWAGATRQLLACVIDQRWHRTLYPAADDTADHVTDHAAEYGDEDTTKPETGTEPAAAAATPIDAAVAVTAPTRQLLVDVSAIVRADLRSGIERVVRAQLHALLDQPPAGWRVAPVALALDGRHWRYRYAHDAGGRLVAGDASDDDAVVVAAGDVLYTPDYCPDAVLGAAAQGLYADWRARGVETSFLVHDLLPVLRPECFPEGADAVHAAWLGALAANADRLVCISHAVADQMQDWLDGAATAATAAPAATAAEAAEAAEAAAAAAPAASPLPIAVLHHGADLAASVPSRGMPADAEAVLARVAAAPSFLMVGTLEPRKGHLHALAAFEQLWRAGSQALLVIVGKAGWSGLPDGARRTIPHLEHRLRHHPELGSRLFWLEGASDEFLERLYAGAACLLAPSEGEGFGLPLIEAAQAGLPILARDLPVFREVARDGAFYFSGGPAELAAAVDAWLALRATATLPSSARIEWGTWAQNAAQLALILQGQQAERHWRAPPGAGFHKK